MDAPLTTTNIQAGWRSPRVYAGQALETSEECTASAAEQQVIDEESDRLLLRLVDVMWSYHCLKHTLGDEQLDTLRDSLMQSSSLWHASHQMCHPDGRALRNCFFVLNQLRVAGSCRGGSCRDADRAMGVPGW